MRQENLYTLRWSQPYATENMRPYLRQLRDEYEQLVEIELARGNLKQAQDIIKGIMAL